MEGNPLATVLRTPCSGLADQTSPCVLFVFVSSFFIYCFAERVRRVCIEHCWVLLSAKFCHETPCRLLKQEPVRGVRCQGLSPCCSLPCLLALSQGSSSLQRPPCSAPCPVENLLLAAFLGKHDGAHASSKGRVTGAFLSSPARKP